MHDDGLNTPLSESVEADETVSFPIAFLNELSNAASTDSIISLLALWVPKFIETDRSSVALRVDEDHLAVFAFEGDGAIPEKFPLPIDGTIVGQCYRTKQFKLTPDTCAQDITEADLKMVADKGLMSAMNAPLLVGGECFGTLNVAHRTPEFYGPKHARILQSLAFWAASNIRVQQQFQQLTDREQEARKLAFVTENIGDMILIANKDHKVEWINKSFEDTTGYSMADIGGKTASDVFFGPTSDPEVVKYVADNLAAKKSARYELPTRIKSGQEIWIEARVKPILDDHGNVEMYIGSHRETTEAKLAEQKLRDSEAQAKKLAIIAEHSNDILIIADKDRKIQWVNQAFERITEYTLEEAKGRKAAELFSGSNTNPEVFRQFVSDFLSGKEARAEALCHSKSGEEFWIDMYVQPVFDENGDIEMFISTNRVITEAKHAEQRLRDSEAQAKKLAIIAECSSDILIMSDKDRKIEWVNRAFEKITGYTLDEVKGQVAAELLSGPNTDAVKMKQIFDEISAGHEARGEVISTGKHGQEFWVDINIQPILDKNGDIEMYISTNREITERKRAEQKLQDSQAQAKQLGIFAEQTDDMIIITNATREIEWVNPAFEKTYGYAREEIIGLPPISFLKGPATSTETLERMSQCLQQGQDVLEEIIFYNKSGEEIWVRINLSFTLNERGEPEKLVGIQHDISKLKQREAELIEARDQASLSKSVLDQLSSPVIVKDPDFKFVMVNKAYCDLLGKQPEELLHKTNLENFPDDLKENFLESDQYVLETGEITELDVVVLDTQGGKRDQISRKSIVETDDGNKYVVAVISDVTELNKARLEAERSNRLKSEFLANMSHEIRTPLNGVLGMAQLLERTELDEDQKKFTEIISSSGNSLLSIINDVLDISKVEAGLLELEDEAFNVEEVVQQAKDTVLGIAVEKGLSVDSAVDAAGEFMGDAKRIRQVLINLAGNAVKFTKQGGVHISVTKVEPKGLRFVVNDTGPGISQEQQQTIFERFRQADGSSTRTYGGTGLGLSISTDLVKLMGGEIGVESMPGQGSRFWFFLPLVESEKVLAGAVEDLREIASSAHHDEPQETVKILLAEDNVVNQKVVKAALQMVGGFEIVTAENGVEALERLEEQAFDLVLMDIQMPIMNGDEAIRKIRASSKGYADVPIVALTANAMNDAREKYLDIGANAYLSKPVDIDQLIECVKKYSSEKFSRKLAV